MSEFKNLGIFLREKRLQASLTQKELAESCGNLHTQFVSNWERGLCAPPKHSLQKLIDLLDLNRQSLVNVMVSDYKNDLEEKLVKNIGSRRKRRHA